MKNDSVRLDGCSVCGTSVEPAKVFLSMQHRWAHGTLCVTASLSLSHVKL